MPKISKVITLHTGYASAVNLREEFLDAEKNRARMTRYKPTKAHREVFERLSHCLHPMDKRCYFLTGSYGTGKSHLLLMFANYLANKSDTPEMASFFEHYAAVDPAKADTLLALRAKGRYLVAICDYDTKDDFEEIVLRAIHGASQREEFEGVIDTHYHEAVRRMEDWEAQSKSGGSRLDIYAAFVDELKEKYPDYTVKKLHAALNGFKEEALSIFKELHQSVLRTHFTYDKGNLVAILKDLLSSPKFKERYQGLAILFDEFGYTLENSRLSLNVFQEFAQLCTQGASGCQPVLFIGAGHRSFASYAKVWAQQDFSKVSDRIDEIALTPEGIEDIMGAIVEPKKDHPLWVSEIQPRAPLFNTFLKDCNRLKVFDWLKAPEIRAKIIENVYPVHPMATYCLLKMSTEVGSNNRTVFTFLSGEFTKEEGSYPWFIDTSEILSGQYLNLYTVDLLFTYFRSRLSSSNKELRDAVRKHLLDYEASLREFKKVAGGELFGGADQLPELERLLRTMLVYEICGVQNSEENIAFGLYCKGDTERKVVTNRLKALCDAKILYLNPTAKTYEFRHTSDVDFELLIAEYKAGEKNLPADLSQEVVNVHPLAKGEEFLIAHGYNTAYTEDKRLLREFALTSLMQATTEEKGETEDYFTAMDKRIDRETEWKNSYEGIAVYVLCETTEDIAKAHAAVKANQSERVIVAVPHEPIPIFEAVMNLRAIKAIEKSEEARHFSTMDNARLLELKGDDTKGFQGQFIAARRKYLSGRACTWYGTNGKVLSANPTKEHEAADKGMEALYNKRTKLSHNDLNLRHSKFELPKNIQLRDAVKKVLDLRNEITVDTSYGDDKGEKRYLYRLALLGALRQQGKADGTLHRYQIEPSTAKFAEALPALADMIADVRKLEPVVKLRVVDFCGKYTAPPYGLGPISLSLLFAVVARTFGDSLRLKKDETAIGDLALKDYDTLYKLVEGESALAYLQHREISADERAFLNDLHELFSSEKSAVGTQRTVQEVYTCLETWWNGLPNICKATDTYTTGWMTTAVKLIDAMDRRTTQDAQSFLFGELQVIYGFEADDALTAERVASLLPKLQNDKEAIEGGYDRVKNACLQELRTLFEVEGHTYDDLKQGITNWVNSLDANQLDPNADWHSHESKPLVMHLGKITDVEETLFTTIPQSGGFGLGKVKDWTKDRTTDYLAKFKTGKANIEDNRIKVPVPDWDVEGEVVEKKQDGKAIRVSYRKAANIRFSELAKGAKIYVTSNGEDPRFMDAQRQEITAGQELPPLSSNRKVQFVARDPHGNYSPVTTVVLINEDAKHEIRLPDQLEMGETPVQFVFPKDPEGLRVSARTLFESAIDHKVADKKIVHQLLTELTKEFGES